ncbi:inhibitor of Bruton tyrosine kinase-like [Babylonia areolata]|uniref:inhibitor of Bruton tyrosine kinase-like n=1 Tax=Babylonia areolata TaxID=304850 RepID=UPI003FD66CED
MPFIFEPECGPKCRSKQHSLEVNSVITKGSLLELQAYTRLCHTWAQHTDVAGRSALHVAASCGKIDIVEWLLTLKHQDPSQKDKESGWTALHRALFYGQLAAARLLVQNNADLYCRDHEGLGPLDLVTRDRPRQLTFDAKECNEVYSWGDNTNLTLGHGSEQHRTMPEVVDTFRRFSVSIKQIVMCKYHTVFLAHSGHVYTCGHGQGGRLGHGDEVTCVTPRLVEALQKEECVQVAAARDHTLFLTEKNCLYSCGLNSCHQLGLTVTGNKDTSKSLLPAKVNVKLLKGKTIVGIYAGRFHSVAHTVDGVYTCGLNAGQIGHPKGEQYQSQLRQVSLLHHKDITISKVHTSDAAIVCFTARGDLMLLHEYTCRKIAFRWQDIEKVCVVGGNLDHNTDLDVLREKGGSELKVVLMNNSGKVFMWRNGNPNLKRCHFAIRREVCVKDVAINMGGLLLITDLGEAFAGYMSGKKSVNLHKDADKDNNKEFGTVSLIDLMLKHEVEEISLRRIPFIHRATGLACDVKGRNFAITQGLPNLWLTDVPLLSDSEIYAEYQQLMEEADLYDAIHDCVVQVGDRKWPTHMFILASRADYFRKQVPGLAVEPEPNGEKPVLVVSDVQPDVMEQLLKFIYTDNCDVLCIGNKFAFTHLERRSNGSWVDGDWPEADTIAFDGRVTSAFMVEQRRKKAKGGKEGKKEEKEAQRGRDPVKILQEAARKFGVKGLSKRLEAVKCVNGEIQPSGKKLQPPRRIRYERTKLGELYDVCIRTDDDTMIQCHKCILAARLEYFHSMLGSGWIETSDTKSLMLPIPGNTLQILLDFLYWDESPVVEGSEDLELLCNVLVVADQLLVQRLKEMCEMTLASLMTLRNAGELLEIATAYNADQLILACQQFIILNLPALLESRNLDMVGDETMQELTDYYRSSIGRMSCRIITPWSEGPDHDFLAALTADFDSELMPKARDPGSKKPKGKRRQARTKSGGEEVVSAGIEVKDSPGERRVSVTSESNESCGRVMAEQQVSVASDTSAKSEEDAAMEDAALESGVESMHLAQTSSRPMTIQKSGKPHGWLLVATSPPQQGESRSVDPPGRPLHSPVSPTLEAGISLRSIMQEQQDTSQNVKRKGGGRFSWKEVKKQQLRAAQAQKAASGDGAGHEAGHGPDPPPSAVSPPACPWGSVNKVVSSFRDLMLQDSHQAKGPAPAPSTPTRTPTSAIKMATSTAQPSATVPKNGAVAVLGKSPPVTVNKSSAPTSFSWGLPVRIPSQPPASPTTPTDPLLASSPPENPWQRRAPVSPAGGATASVCFSDIVQDQMDQKHCLERAAQKPLHLIQMEEEAISQLLRHYRAHDRFDEHITVERVSGPMAAPLWHRQRTPSSSHP